MQDRLTVDIVRHVDQADPDAICVTLFQEKGRLMAWFIGPAELNGRGLWLPYLPRSARREIAAAITMAMAAAIVARRNVCIVDPCELWAPV